jgi:hypothetical protein
VPFFIAELARSINARGEHADGAPSSLDPLILDRVAKLPEDARGLLRQLREDLSTADGAPLELSQSMSRSWVAPLRVSFRAEHAGCA